MFLQADRVPDDYQPVRLRLSVKSASQPAIFFSHKKPASSTFSQPDQLKRTRFPNTRTWSWLIISIPFFTETPRVPAIMGNT
jgi:hypothetical protein